MADAPTSAGRTTANGSSPALSPLHAQPQGPVAGTQPTNNASPPLPPFTSFTDDDVSREEQEINALLAQFDSPAPFDTVDPSALSSPTPMLHAPDPSCFVSRSCNDSPFDTMTPASNAATVGTPMDVGTAWPPPSDCKAQTWPEPTATQWWASSTPRTPGQEDSVQFGPSTEPVRRSARPETTCSTPRLQPPKFHHPRPFTGNGGLAMSPQQAIRAHSMPPQGPGMSPGQTHHPSPHMQHLHHRNLESRPHSYHPQQQQRQYHHAPSHSVPQTPQPAPSFPPPASPSPAQTSPQIIFTRAVQPRNMRVNPPVPIAVSAPPPRKQTPSSPPRHPYPAALTAGSRPPMGAMVQQRQGPGVMRSTGPPNRMPQPVMPGPPVEVGHPGMQHRQRKYVPGPYHPYAPGRAMAMAMPRSTPAAPSWTGVADAGMRMPTDDVRMRIGSITELPVPPDVTMGGMSSGPEAGGNLMTLQDRSVMMDSAPLEPAVHFKRDSLSIAAALASEMDFLPRLSLSGFSLPGSLGTIEELEGAPSNGDQEQNSNGNFCKDVGQAQQTNGGAAISTTNPAPTASRAPEASPGHELDENLRRRCSSLSELEQWKFRMMNDQTTLSLGTLSHIERLQAELDNLKRFATSGFCQVKDGMDRDLESKRLELRNMNAGTTELNEPLNAIPSSMRKDSVGKYNIPPLVPLNGEDIKSLDNDGIVALLESYKLPFDKEMFLFQKKEVYLKFIGACRELMHKVLD
ncbi:hypothetical protein HDK90DRAFT_467437 [Phyllosticta capitalensis]|uniref:Uncharacterized protein n=1 Tax=Phyllosticta capitalensis TaxID=121624 RepID=A0ABR1YKD0_9PEZI